MSPSFKLITVAIATTAAVAVSFSAASASPAGSAVKPGRVGKTITLDSNMELIAYDVASDASGRAYVGWISDKGSDGRKIHLCVLPPGARQCKGGIQTIGAPQPFGPSTSQGLRVLATPGGVVTLVWMLDTPASENGPQASEIATATMRPGGHLSQATEVATAPSFGTMLDATSGPNGSIWVITEKSVVNGVQVREGLSGSFVNLRTPYGVGAARLRFSHGVGVLVIQKDGAISAPVAAGSFRNGAFSGFSKVRKTWTSDATLGLTATTSGIRMVTSVNNPSYRPVIWSWGGSGFGHPTLTGDFNACTPSSHDLVADASGRAADVSKECSDVAIANLADTRHAAVTRFSERATLAGGDPQLTTNPRGTGWVVWSIQAPITNKLFVAPIVLPDRVVTASASGRRNRVTVHGPASCLPPVDIAVGVTAKPARKWHVVSKTLRLGTSVLHSATLHGGGLTAGKTYILSGTVKFASGGSHVTVTAKVKFRSCPK